MIFFFFSSRRRHTRFDCDWSSDVCSSDLYFASDRPGGLGGTDIYAAAQLVDGTFGPAVLIPELSSPSDDVAPAVRRDGLEVFIASTRLGGLGEQDIWVATRATTSDPWSPAADLGPLINSENSEGGPALSADATALFFYAALRPGNVGTEGRLDLWVTTRARLDDADDDDRRFRTRGKVKEH